MKTIVLASPDVGEETLRPDPEDEVSRRILRAFYESCAPDICPDLWIDDQQEAIEHVRGCHLAGILQLTYHEHDGKLEWRFADFFKKSVDAQRTITEWVAQPLVLTKPGSSRWHRLKSSALECTLPVYPGRELPRLSEFARADNVAPLVIEHDWAGALAAADIGKLDEMRLPSDRCVFEFRISGKSVCALIDESLSVELFIELEQGWIPFNPELMKYTPVAVAHDYDTESIGLDVERLTKLVGDQINGALVALDARVAETEVVRASGKLNKARLRRGKPPIPDYRVVRLAKRYSAAPRLACDAGEPKRRIRLHFRRGHWRHYDSHKAWINWTLVGDPDLGFIEKHYSL